MFFLALQIAMGAPNFNKVHTYKEQGDRLEQVYLDVGKITEIRKDHRYKLKVQNPADLDYEYYCEFVYDELIIYSRLDCSTLVERINRLQK